MGKKNKNKKYDDEFVEKVSLFLIKNYKNLDKNLLESLSTFVAHRIRYYINKYDSVNGVNIESYILLQVKNDIDKHLCEKYKKIYNKMHVSDMEETDMLNILDYFIKENRVVYALLSKSNYDINDDIYNNMVEQVMFKYDGEEPFNIKLTKEIKKYMHSTYEIKKSL